jgi:hypothetical protein
MLSALHSVHSRKPHGAPQRGQARHWSMKAKARLQRAQSTEPGLPHTAQRVGQSVSAASSPNAAA